MDYLSVIGLNMKLLDQINTAQKLSLQEFLSGFVTPGRMEKFRERIRYRTRYITVVLENIYQPHNASAVLRSCDCFGIQDVHILEDRNPYKVNPDVALGSSKWLSLYRPGGDQQNSRAYLMRLKQNGYQLVATTPHHDNYTPDTLPMDQKVALLFGTELDGLSPPLLELADSYVRIPMVGFTESLNISVSAAILAYTLTGRLKSSGLAWSLTDDEKTDILLTWLNHSIKHADKITRDYAFKNGWIME